MGMLSRLDVGFVSLPAMTFLDDDDRRGAVRVAQGTVIRAAVALFLAIAAPFGLLFAGPLYALVIAVGAVGLATSAIVTLSHPQASVVGGLRVIGFVLAGIAVGVGLLEIVVGVLRYVEYGR